MNLSTSNPRPKKRLKMPDLTWHDLPIEIKEYIVLGAPKELRSLFRLVCCEWYTIVNPYVIKFPSKQTWGKYHTKHYQTAAARWALRTENVNLLEWLVLKQGMLPPKKFDIHSSWIKLAAKEPRYALVHRLMSSWTWGAYCQKLAVIALRSGDMRLLKLSFSKEMTVSEFGEHIKKKKIPRILMPGFDDDYKYIPPEMEYVISKDKICHAPFADMDKNGEMIKLLHSTDCEKTRNCVWFQLNEIIKAKQSFAVVEQFINQEKYQHVSNKYFSVLSIYCEYGSLKGVIWMLDKYGHIEWVTPSSAWRFAFRAGQLHILKYLLNIDKELSSKENQCTHYSVHKPVRKRDHELLEWLFDNNLFLPGEVHFRNLVYDLGDDPGLLPMLRRLMERREEPLKLDSTAKWHMTMAGIQTKQVAVIHWLHKQGYLTKEVSGRPLGDRMVCTITRSAANGCYHLLRLLHNLKVCNLSYTIMCSETMTLMYDDRFISMGEEIKKCGMFPYLYDFIPKGRFYECDTFNFISSELGKLNPPPSF